MTKKIFAEQLKKAFRESGLTQKEIAKKLGVSQVQVSRWVNGEAQPSLDKLPQILQLSGTDANYFFDSPQITHSGTGDIAVNSTIKKSPDSASDFQLLRDELRALITELKNHKK